LAINDNVVLKWLKRRLELIGEIEIIAAVR
jgi:hypothetical protein